MKCAGDGAIATYENAFLIYNPAAGKLLRNPRLIQRIIEALRGRGHRVAAEPTTGPHTGAGIARACLSRGADLILAAGGDGTINEVANGMAHSEVPLGILPAGTANVLAVETRMSTRLPAAAERIRDYVPLRIALGRLEATGQDPRLFLLMAGIGLDAMIVYNVSAGLKARLGKAAYWVAGFSHVGRPLPEFSARVDGSETRCSFALASRVRNYGGDITIARNASLGRADFEVVLFAGAWTTPYLKYFAGALAGRLPRMKGVTITRATTLELSNPADTRIYIQIDGEFAGRLPARVDIVPSALTLLVPPAFSVNG